MSDKIKTAYVSEIDQFLQQYDREHPELSRSQQKEIAKHERVYRLRDNTAEPNLDDRKELWDKF